MYHKLKRLHLQKQFVSFVSFLRGNGWLIRGLARTTGEIQGKMRLDLIEGLARFGVWLASCTSTRNCTCTIPIRDSFTRAFLLAKAVHLR